MAYDHYGQMGDDSDRRNDDRDRYQERNRSQNSDGEPGFIERAGEEIRSWFSDDGDQGRNQGSNQRDNRMQNDHSRQNVNRYGERGAHNVGRGYSSDSDSSGSNRYGSDPDRERSRSHSGSYSYGSRDPQGSSDRSVSSSDRYSSGGRGQSGYGSQPGRYGTSSQDRYGSSSQNRNGSQNQQSGERYGSGGRDNDDSGVLIYEEISGTLGGFGNQTFASTPDDHYRSWRDRQMAQLDNDYRDYCKDREQDFHSSFETWRSSRRGQQSQSETDSSSGLPSGSSSSATESPRSTPSMSDPTSSSASNSSGSKQSEAAGAASGRPGTRSRS